jgi:hypothetical protein
LAGTTADTQRPDWLDGLIVQRVRRARRAARSAGRENADPALAAAFELSKLYRGKSAGAAAAALGAKTASAKA